MPNTIPATGEAMPKTTRRAFLAGVAVAAVPVSVAAQNVSPQVEVSLLKSLVDTYNETLAEADRIDNLVRDLWDSPDRPEEGKLTKAELSHDYRWHMRNQAVLTKTGVNTLFDKQRDLIELNSTLWADKSHFPARYAKIEEDRAHYLAIWEAREAVFQEWRVSSGFKALSDEEDRLAILECELNDLILEYPIRTLEEARIKAAHVSKVYGSNMGGEDFTVFLASIINAAGAA